MNKFILSHADSTRLNILANEAGRLPDEVLQFVLRDGFDATEYSVKSVKSRMQSDQRVSHEDAMRQIDDVIDFHAKNQKKAA